MGVKERIEAAGGRRVGQCGRRNRTESKEMDGLLCAFPYRTPVGVTLKAGIALAVNGSFVAGMVVGR